MRPQPDLVHHAVVLFFFGSVDCHRLLHSSPQNSILSPKVGTHSLASTRHPLLLHPIPILICSPPPSAAQSSALTRIRYSRLLWPAPSLPSSPPSSTVSLYYDYHPFSPSSTTSPLTPRRSTNHPLISIHLLSICHSLRFLPPTQPGLQLRLPPFILCFRAFPLLSSNFGLFTLAGPPCPDTIPLAFLPSLVQCCGTTQPFSLSSRRPPLRRR